MSLSEGAENQEDLREEFIKKLADHDEAVDISSLMKETSAADREETKRILREMIDEGMITTSPGFKYKLASDISPSSA